MSGRIKLAVAAAALFAGALALAQEAAKADLKWDDLSKEILPKVLAANGDRNSMLQQVRGLECDVEVRVSTNQSYTPVIVLFHHSWKDGDDNGLLSPDEIEVETKQVSQRGLERAVRGLRDRLNKAYENPLPALLAANFVRAARIEGGYKLQLKPVQGKADKDPAYDVIYATIDDQFRVTDVRVKAVDGSDVYTKMKHVRIGDKWYSTGYNARTVAQGATSTEDVTYTYTDVQGVPMVTRSVIRQSHATAMGTMSSTEDWMLKNLRIEKRTTPLKMPGEDDEGRLFPDKGKTAQKTPDADEALFGGDQGKGAKKDDTGLFDDGGATGAGAADPELGLVKTKPIKIGMTAKITGAGGQDMGDMAKTIGAVMAVSDYQDSLRDDQGRPVKTEMLPPEKGAAPDGHTLNTLKVTTQDGKTVMIYFDAYHPELGVDKAPAPKGFTRAAKGAAVEAGLGLSLDKAIKMGAAGKDMGPAMAVNLYMRNLRDAKDRPVQFERLGQAGTAPDGHIVDKYQVETEDGERFLLFLDGYHPEINWSRAQTPKGFRLAGKTPPAGAEKPKPKADGGLFED